MTQSESILQHLNTSWINDVKEHISQQLEQRSNIDEIEFGQLLADALAGCSGQFVFTQGKFWCFSEQIGLYEPVDDVDLRKLLYDRSSTF